MSCSWHLFYGVTFKAFPLQVASKTSVPRAATHMRDCPVLAGWPADVGNNRHTNVNVKPQTATLRRVRQQYKSKREKERKKRKDK